MARMYGADSSDNSKLVYSDDEVFKKSENKKSTTFGRPIISILGVIGVLVIVVILGFRFLSGGISGGKLSFKTVKKMYQQAGHQQLSADEMIDVVETSSMGSLSADSSIAISQGVYTILSSEADMTKFAEYGFKQPGMFSDYNKVFIDMVGDSGYYTFCMLAECKSSNSAELGAADWLADAGGYKDELSSSDSIVFIDGTDDSIRYFFGKSDVNLSTFDESNPIHVGSIMLGGLVEDHNLCVFCSIDYGESTKGQRMLNNVCANLDVITPSQAFMSSDGRDVNDNISTISIAEEYIGTYNAINDVGMFISLDADGTCTYPVSYYDDTKIQGLWSVKDGILTIKPMSGPPEKPNTEDYMFESGGYMLPNQRDTWMPAEEFENLDANYEAVLQEYNDSIIQTEITSEGFTYQDIFYAKQ